MKPIITTILGILISINSYSQTTEFTEITKGEMFSVDNAGRVTELFRLNNGEIVTLEVLKEDVIVTHYNKDFRFKSKSAPIKFAYNPKTALNRYPQFYLTNNDKLILTFSQHITKEKRKIVWANILNLEEDKFELSVPVKLGEINRTKFSEFNIKFNKEKTQFVFAGSVPVKKPKPHHEVYYKLYNTDFDLLWEKRINEKTFYSINNRTLRVAENEMLVTYMSIYDKKGENIDRYHFSVFDSDGNIEKEFDLKVSDKIISDLEVTINKHNKLIAGGIYKTKKNGNPIGFFNFSNDLNDIEEHENNIHIFTEELLSAYETKTKKNRIREAFQENKTPGIKDLEIKEIATHKEGCFLIMNSNWTVNYSNGSATEVSKDYIVASFSEENELLWLQKVPMSARGFRVNFDKIICKNGNLYIFHWDTEENFVKFEKLKETGKRNYDTDCFVIQKINKDGNLDRELLFKIYEFEIKGKGSFYKSFSNIENSVIFFYYNNEKGCFVKIETNE